MHYITLQCIAFALHCIALHCIALHCIALHCIALHFIANKSLQIKNLITVLLYVYMDKYPVFLHTTPPPPSSTFRNPRFTQNASVYTGRRCANIACWLSCGCRMALHDCVISYNASVISVHDCVLASGHCRPTASDVGLALASHNLALAVVTSVILFAKKKQVDWWLVTLTDGCLCTDDVICIDKPGHTNQAKTRNSTNGDFMLAKRRRRWANIKSTSVQCLVFAGNKHGHVLI